MIIWAVAQQGVEWAIGSFNPLALLYYQMGMVDLYTGSVANYITSFIPYVMINAVPAILSPLIIAIVLITSFRALSPALGGEVQILGMSELI
jgi:hypothetical protein